MIYMNTKTTKFLAVLAVFAMAFAAFAVVLPAGSDDAAGEAQPAAKIEGTVPTSTTIASISGNLILEADKEYTIAVTVGSTEYGIYLLPGAKIKMTGASETATFTTGIIFGAAVAKTEGNATVYYHATASEITFVQGKQALTDYELSCNADSVITIKSTSEYLTQDNITVSDESTNTAWGGEFDIEDVVINEAGTLKDVTVATAYAGIDNAKTVVANAIVVKTGASELTVRGMLVLSKGMTIDSAVTALTLTATAGTVTGDITGGDTASAFKVHIEACSGIFAITGTTTYTVTSVTAGQLTLVSGGFKAAEDPAVAVGEKATLNIASGATLTVTFGSTLNIDGAMYLSGKLTSSKTGTAATLLVGNENKDAVFKTRIGAAMTGINFSKDSKGSVDITTVLNEVGLSGQIESSNSYTASQVVTLLGDLTITNHAVIQIHGFLVIPAGYTLKIDDGSVLIVDGIFSESEVYGDIEVSKDSALYVALAKSFDIHGELITNASDNVYASLLIKSNFTAMEGSTLELAGATLIDADNAFGIEAGATVYIAGPVMTKAGQSNEIAAYILNAGNLVLDGATIATLTGAETGFVTVATAQAAANLAVKMTGSGALVDVENLKFNKQSSVLKVTDEGVKAGLLDPAEYFNTITVSAVADNDAISGLVIGETVSSTVDKKDNYHTKNTMSITGEVAVTSASSTETSAAEIEVAQTGETKTYGSFTIEDELELLTKASLTFAASAEKVVVNGDVKVEIGATFAASAVGSITVKGSIDSYEALDADTYSACIGAQFKADTHSYIITTVPAAMTFAAVQEGKVTVTIYGANTITDDMYITANVKMVAGTGAEITIKKDVTVVVIEGASVAVDFKVNGTLYANVEKNITGTVTADVKVTDGVAAKWTSLANALASAEAGDIILITNSTLKISDNLTIPVDVTVVIPDGTATTIVDKKTLTVNGALVSDSPITLDLTKGAKIVVNGLARFVGSDPASTYEKYKIDGAYYTEDNYVYVSNLELASQSEVTAITIYGTVTESKEVSFALQTITLADGAVLKVSDLVLSGLADVNAEKGKLSGTVTAAGLDGEAVAIMNFTDYAGCVGNYFGDLVGTAFIDEITGTVSIMSGTVTLFSEEVIENGGTLNVILGAEFIVYNNEEVTISKGTNTGTIYVAGKLTIDSDKFVNAGIIDVVYDEDDSIKGVLTVTEMTMEIGGITVDDGAVFNLNGDLTLGYAATSVDGVAAIEGVVTLDNDNYIIAYANADVSEMIVNPTADGVSTAKTTEFYINDMLYMTLIAGSTNDITYLSVIEDLTFAIEELDETQLAALKTSAGWGIKDSDTIGTYDELSAEIDYKLIAIQASWVKGLSLYVDGVRISVPGELDLSVGTHTVSVTVDAGYACDNIGITFNGVAVTPAGIFVEVDDTGAVLAVTGDVYIPEPEPVTPEEKSEWTITTILLVILVILIAIMAVIVALRLNRS